MRSRDYVPDTIILEYARWLTPAEERARGFVAPSGTSVAMEKAADGRRDAAIDQLPPSAWRKITIKPKQLIAKYQHRMPAGHPEGYLFPDSRTREIWIQMDMQADGTVKISERYKWRYGSGGISNWR